MASLTGAATKPTLLGAARHVAYAGGWKKSGPLWDMVIRAERVSYTLPTLESILNVHSRHPSDEQFGAPQELAGGV